MLVADLGNGFGDATAGHRILQLHPLDDLAAVHDQQVIPDSGGRFAQDRYVSVDQPFRGQIEQDP